jgi:glycosyltransferase involved in cell wall biosynthesis
VFFDEVICFTSGYPGAGRFENLDSVKFYRFGLDYTPPLITLKSREVLKNQDDAIILENVNHIPFYTPIIYPRSQSISIIHHVAKSQLYMEAPIIAPIIDMLERGISPLLYRNKLVIAPSKSTAAQLARLGYNRVHVIPPGVDYEKLSEGSKRYAKKQYTIIYFGRIMKYKQIHHLIKALARVVEEIPDVRLTIAGKACSQQYLTQLYSLIDRLNLEKHVIIRVNVPEREKIRLLAEAQVYATATIQEGWAITVIEANACGTPAVGYNVPGLRDSINEKTGILVKPGDVKTLAETLTYLLMDDGLREKLSKNALEWSKQFSWDKATEEFLKLLGFCKNKKSLV